MSAKEERYRRWHREEHVVGKCDCGRLKLTACNQCGYEFWYGEGDGWGCPIRGCDGVLHVKRKIG